MCSALFYSISPSSFYFSYRLWSAHLKLIILHNYHHPCCHYYRKHATLNITVVLAATTTTFVVVYVRKTSSKSSSLLQQLSLSLSLSLFNDGRCLIVVGYPRRIRSRWSTRSSRTVRWGGKSSFVWIVGSYSFTPTLNQSAIR